MPFFLNTYTFFFFFLLARDCYSGWLFATRMDFSLFFTDWLFLLNYFIENFSQISVCVKLFICNLHHLLLSSSHIIEIGIKNNSLSLSLSHTHTHTLTYLYIYIYILFYLRNRFIYIYIYVCVCIKQNLADKLNDHYLKQNKTKQTTL